MKWENKKIIIIINMLTINIIKQLNCNTIKLKVYLLNHSLKVQLQVIFVIR